MYSNTGVTVYNRYINASNEYAYQRTYLDNVHWEGLNSRNKNTFGVESNDTVKISIGFNVLTESAFKKPKIFQALEDKTGYFTFDVDDKIVKGFIPSSVDFEDLESDFDDVITITSVDTADYGSSNMQHWEVYGK